MKGFTGTCSFQGRWKHLRFTQLAINGVIKGKTICR
jgi:hypothetical protein